MEIDLQEIHASTKILNVILKMQLRIEGFLSYTSFCKMTSDKAKHTSGRNFMFDTRKKATIPQELQQPLRRYVAQADGKLCGYCKENLCNTENGRMIVELYLGKQEHHVSRILY